MRQWSYLLSPETPGCGNFITPTSGLIRIRVKTCNLALNQRSCFCRARHNHECWVYPDMAGTCYRTRNALCAALDAGLEQLALGVLKHLLGLLERALWSAGGSRVSARLIAQSKTTQASVTPNAFALAQPAFVGTRKLTPTYAHSIRRRPRREMSNKLFQPCELKSLP